MLCSLVLTSFSYRGFFCGHRRRCRRLCLYRVCVVIVVIGYLVVELAVGGIVVGAVGYAVAHRGVDCYRGVIAAVGDYVDFVVVVAVIVVVVVVVAVGVVVIVVLVGLPPPPPTIDDDGRDDDDVVVVRCLVGWTVRPPQSNTPHHWVK